MHRIVFIDDDAHFIDGLRRMFHPYRNLWELVFTTDSSKVLGSLADDVDTVIVSDLMMPRMNGIELCNQVRKISTGNKNSAVYFILLSNAKDSENKTLGLESGADDYIEKPFKQDELVARIKIGIRLLDAKTQLREAGKRAMAHSAAKSEALANLSHEIRNPMNAILGMSSLLKEAELPNEAMEMVQTIHSASEGLLGLLNDILDVSKIEAGKFELDEYEFDLQELIQNVVEVSAVSAREKRTVIGFSFPENRIGMLMGDAKRLRQVLLNLVSNAVKFTSAGRIQIDVSIERDDASYQRLCVRISDTGIGIPIEKQGRLFKAFSQADAATQTRFGGTGLGLALSRKIVQLMGGDLTLASVEGKGTVFSFSVLFGKSENKKKDDGKKSPYSPIENGDRLRVLVADDNVVNQKVATLMIRKLGVMADTAGDGAEVLKMLQQQYFDLVLMDVEMPTLDGLAATRIIRAGGLPFVNKRPRIVTLTGHAMKGDEQRFLSAGVDSVMTKPIRPEVLKAELMKLTAVR